MKVTGQNIALFFTCSALFFAFTAPLVADARSRLTRDAFFPSAGGNKVFEQQVGSVPPSKPSAPEEPRPLIYGHGPGTCPTGVQAVPGEKPGQIVLCNGMRPNCPPSSYCYATAKVQGAGLFNCCKA